MSVMPGGDSPTSCHDAALLPLQFCVSWNEYAWPTVASGNDSVVILALVQLVDQVHAGGASATAKPRTMVTPQTVGTRTARPVCHLRQPARRRACSTLPEDTRQTQRRRSAEHWR